MVYRADERPQSRSAVYLRNSREAMRDDKESRRRGGADPWEPPSGRGPEATRGTPAGIPRCYTAARLQPNFLATL